MVGGFEGMVVGKKVLGVWDWQMPNYCMWNGWTAESYCVAQGANCIQHPVMDRNRKCVYAWLGRLAMQQKWARHCEPTML